VYHETVFMVHKWVCPPGVIHKNTRTREPGELGAETDTLKACTSPTLPHGYFPWSNSKLAGARRKDWLSEFEPSCGTSYGLTSRTSKSGSAFIANLHVLLPSNATMHEVVAPPAVGYRTVLRSEERVSVWPLPTGWTSGGTQMDCEPDRLRGISSGKRQRPVPDVGSRQAHCDR
jgi:hypothetical protein